MQITSGEQMGGNVLNCPETYHIIRNFVSGNIPSLSQQGKPTRSSSSPRRPIPSRRQDTSPKTGGQQLIGLCEPLHYPPPFDRLRKRPVDKSWVKVLKDIPLGPLHLTIWSGDGGMIPQMICIRNYTAKQRTKLYNPFRPLSTAHANMFLSYSFSQRSLKTS